MTLSLAESIQHISRVERGNRKSLETILRSIAAAEAGPELQYLNGVTAGTALASKALVLNSSGELDGVPGEIAFDGNKMAVEAGAGFTAPANSIYLSSVMKVGNVIKTKILIDLTGVSSATSDLDIIGIGAVAPAHLGQITAARNGTIIGGRVRCLEVPASLNDVDFYSATVGTGATTYFEAAIGSLVETALVTKGGAWSLNDVSELLALPAADSFLYMVNGEADTPAVFTAGRFLIELEGYDA